MSTIKVDTIATRTGSGDITSSNNISLADNTRVKLGTGDDIQIYHDGSYSRIMESGGTGLVLDTTSVDTRITSDNSKVMGKFIKDGAVQLFHNNSQKLSTASTGINITGGIGLGGTGSANILDDYEEGTWTPAVTVGTVSTANGHYKKIGGVVFFRAYMTGFANSTNNESMFITGLPFTIAVQGATGVAMWENINSDFKFDISYVNGSSQVQFYYSHGSSYTEMRHIYLDGSNSGVHFQGTYFTDQ